MNNKMRSILIPYAMMAAGMYSEVQDQSMMQRKPCPSQIGRNANQKCFVKGCTNKRTGNHLFCSAECSQLHRAGKVKHQYCLFPQLPQWKLKQDLEAFDWVDKSIKVEDVYQAQFGYVILRKMDQVLIHS